MSYDGVESRYGVRLDDFREDIKVPMQAAGLFEREDITDFKDFNTHGYFNPYDTLDTTFEYVFITRPDLWILNSDGTLNEYFSNVPTFVESFHNAPHVIQDLCLHVQTTSQASAGNKQVFSPILYNHREGTLDLPDTDAADEETAENMYGQKIYYRRSSSSSNDNYDFSLDFFDNRYLDTYMWFKLFDMYEDRKALGRVPLYKDEYYREHYIGPKRLHDQISIYKIVCGPDGRTIVYWAKLWGVYPKGSPRSAFSSLPEDGHLKFTVNFKCNWVDDMDPNILADFNAVAAKYGQLPAEDHREVDVNAGLGGQTSRFSPGPYIKRVTSRYRPSRFLLLWR